MGFRSISAYLGLSHNYTRSKRAAPSQVPLFQSKSNQLSHSHPLTRGDHVTFQMSLGHLVSKYCWARSHLLFHHQTPRICSQVSISGCDAPEPRQGKVSPWLRWGQHSMNLRLRRCWGWWGRDQRSKVVPFRIPNYIPQEILFSLLPSPSYDPSPAPPHPHSGTTQRLHGRKQVSIVFFSYLQFLEFLAPWSPSPWCHCGKRLRGRFRGCHWWAGRLDSNSSSSRPAFLGLGKDSSLSELQWLVDCVILETDKVKPFSVSFCLSVSVCVSRLRRLSTWRPCRGLAVWDAGSLFGLTPALCTVPLSHTFQYMPGFLQLRNLKLAITLEETEILGHRRPTGSSINGTSAFQRFKSNSLRKVPENKDYPLKHPKIAFTKKALCREINLNVAFHNSKALPLY